MNRSFRDCDEGSRAVPISPIQVRKREAAMRHRLGELTTLGAPWFEDARISRSVPRPEGHGSVPRWSSDGSLCRRLSVIIAVLGLALAIAPACSLAARTAKPTRQMRKTVAPIEAGQVIHPLTNTKERDPITAISPVRTPTYTPAERVDTGAAGSTGRMVASGGALWVDAVHGHDGDNGLTPSTAFCTIQRAADVAGPGSTVHILPGVYRESVRPAMSGTAAKPVLYLAEEGPGTVILRGSEPTSSLAWTQLTADTIGLPPSVDPGEVYFADLSAWNLEGAPRFVVELDRNGKTIARLPLAREPDWEVVTSWKHHEFWWAADGGSDVARCDPATDPDPTGCDLASRSTTQLTDRADDPEPAGIEAGNLTTLGDLTGATLVALDTDQGHWVCRGAVVSHDVRAGRVTLGQECEDALGWGSKYYVEGLPSLLDSAGEWWYDATSDRLYLWPRTPGNPAAMNIEISRRDRGFYLEDRSYITLDGLTIDFYDETAVYMGNAPNEKSHHNTVRNATLRYANFGVYVHQEVGASSSPQDMIDGFTLEDSEVSHMDTYAVFLSSWWEDRAAPDAFTRPGVSNAIIRHNELHHLGFNTSAEAGDGAMFVYPNRLRFEGNHVHHVAHNGIQFLKSVIQSPEGRDLEADKIKTGEILIKDNVFERACLLTTDCGALKIWGAPPHNHVFRDLLITGNVFRDTFGWTYVSEKRGLRSGGTSSSVQGLGGRGLYVDMASGIHVYRNIAYNNAFAGFVFYGHRQDGEMICYNNIAANSLYGFRLDVGQDDTDGNVSTELVNNIVVNNEGYGLYLDIGEDHRNVTIDHNLYFRNGWRAHEEGGLRYAGDMMLYWPSADNDYLQTLSEIQASTEWEMHGVEGNPLFWSYDVNDHDLFEHSWPILHLTGDSANALERGTTTLPDSLAALLNMFGVSDFRKGQAYDIGRYERGFTLVANPAVRFLDPGGEAQYALSLQPFDLPYAVTLAVTAPSPDLTPMLDSAVLAPGTVVTLTIADSHVGPPLVPALAYTVPVTARGPGLTETASLRVFVGGAIVYLPVILRNHGGV